MVASEKKASPALGSLANDAIIKQKLISRMRTINGHVSGVSKMVEGDAYCIDILKQIAAVQASLSKVAMSLSESHMRCCVHSAITHGEGQPKIDELMETLKYLKYF